MELTSHEEEMKAHLLASSDEFRELVARHAEYDRRLEELEAMTHPTEDEQIEEVRLKKLKLHLKDQINGLLHQQPNVTVS